VSASLVVTSPVPAKSGFNLRRERMAGMSAGSMMYRIHPGQIMKIWMLLPRPAQSSEWCWGALA